MQTTISKELYNLALTRIDELLPLVNETTAENDPKMIELCHFSDIVENYEDEHYPIAMPSFASVIEERLSEEHMQKKTLAKHLGVSASRISEFLNEKAEPSLSQARNICRILHIEPHIALQI